MRAPLGHWIIAVILAVGVAWGAWVWLGHRAARSAQTATLSFDTGVARKMDPDLADAAEPAVATAESMLTDPVVADLAKAATLPSLARTARIGEFRSRLELRQSSASLLQVQFRDDSAERSAQAANAVAGALTAESPAPANVPAAAVPSPALQPAPVKASVAGPSSQSNHALADALGQLEAELFATQKKLESLSSDAWQRREHPELSSYRESKEQQLLTAQVGAALKEIADLRAKPANGAAAEQPLRRIQEALLSVWPASRSARTSALRSNFMGFNAAGVDVSRLREERAEFAQALAVVRKEQGAVQRLQVVPPAQAPPSSASQSPAAVPAAAAASSQSSSAVEESNIAKLPAEEPFELQRPAGTPVHTPWWPVVLAGFGCGMLYLVVAGSRYRQDEEEEDYEEESSADSQRMITPARPMRPADFFSSADPRPGDLFAKANAQPADFFAKVAARSADFPARTNARSADFFAKANPQPAEVVLARPVIERPDPPADLREEKGANGSGQEIVLDAEETKRTSREGVGAEEGEADPWVDSMMKTLSETSIGKMFETPTAEDREEDQEAEDLQHPIRPDRLAG
jgi:hypothetical protein